jgi:hypothetical protein
MYPNQPGPRPYGDPRDQNWPPLQPILPTRRRRRTGLWITVGLLTVIVVGGAAAFGIYLLSRTGDSPRTTADRYLSAIKDHDSAAARDQVCTAQQGRATSLVPSSFKIDSYQLGSVRESGDRADVEVRLTGSLGTAPSRTVPIVLRMNKDSGAWRVCP